MEHKISTVVKEPKEVKKNSHHCMIFCKKKSKEMGIINEGVCLKNKLSILHATAIKNNQLDIFNVTWAGFL